MSQKWATPPSPTEPYWFHLDLQPMSKDPSPKPLTAL